MKRAVALLVIAVVLVLTLSGAVLAATPQDIYDDYAADQKIDGTYTEAEWRAWLDNAYMHQYGHQPWVTALDNLARGVLEDRDEFPFTGAQLALMALGALALIGGGVGLRRLVR